VLQGKPTQLAEFLSIGGLMVLRLKTEKSDEERRFRMMADGFPFLIWVEGPNGERQFVNRAYCEFFGGEAREEILGQCWRTLVHPEDQETYISEFLTCIRERRQFKAEARVKRGDGHWRWVESFASPQFAETGEFMGMVGISPDITERKQAEEALRESEERLRLLGDNLPDSVVYQNSYHPNGQSRFLYISAGVERVRGVGVQDVMSDAGTLRRQILPEYLDKVNEEEKRSINELSDFDMDVPIRLSDGQVRWVQLHSRPRRMPDGRIIWDGVQTDITERKRKEEDLRRLSQFPGENPNPVLRVDSNGMLMYANTSGQTWLASLGWEPNGPLPDAVCSAVRKALSRSQVIECEISNSQEKAFALTVIQPEGEDYVNLYGKDVTARKQMEQELRRSNEKLEVEVKKRTATLISLNEELETRAEQLRRLAGELTMAEQRERKRLAKILHDGLQQYLVAAKLQTGGLIHPLNGAETNKTATEIEILLNEAVKVSRTLAAELSPPILHDSGLLAGLEWLARWKSDKHGIKVELKMEQMDAPMLLEEVKVFLFEAVRELLLNVVKHSGTKSATINLSHEDNRHLKISVTDDGRGFDAAMITAGNQEIGGLGLFSIRERISLIGGKFEYDSSPGKGARFTLTVPLSTPAHERHESTTIAQWKEGQCASALSKGKIRIMLVDDHAVMREGLARLLAQETDFEVVVQANDGKQAIEKACALLPDVLLMDISMPVMDGIAATRIIHQKHPCIHIIGLSLYTDDERAREMLDAGATFYLTKSGPPADLKSAIRACMKDKAADGATSSAGSRQMKN
jgi:PAS domain S-box-containing protein